MQLKRRSALGSAVRSARLLVARGGALGLVGLVAALVLLTGLAYEVAQVRRARSLAAAGLPDGGGLGARADERVRAALIRKRAVLANAKDRVAARATAADAGAGAGADAGADADAGAGADAVVAPERDGSGSGGGRARRSALLDDPELVRLRVFLQRIRLWLHPFTAKHTGKFHVDPLIQGDRECGELWTSVRKGFFLKDCPDAEPECGGRDSLQEAKALCMKLGEGCGGVTFSRDSNKFEVRKGRELLPDADEASWAKLPDPCSPARLSSAQESRAESIWEAFYQAVDASLEDEYLGLRDKLGPAREDDSVFISIASYRDGTCPDTLRKAFLRAGNPNAVSVGIVQQNCQSKTQCYTGTGWAQSRRWVQRPGADPDCAADFCASELGKPHCDAGRVRVLRLDEIDSLGPFFTRFVNSKLYRGENFYMQIDAHTDFRQDWDKSLVAQMRATPSYPHSVISNYPPSGTPRSDHDWAAPRRLTMEDNPGHVPGALCACSFETAGAGRYTVRLAETGRQISSSFDIPRETCFVAAGFFIAHGSIVDDVGFDPFLPYLFMGEELALSLRFWSNGYDLYAPSVNALAHEYVRKEAPKFWESVGHVYSRGNIHNELTDLIVQRVQFLSKFPEADTPDKVQPSSLLLRMSEFGVGEKRTADEFAKHMGLDFERKTQQVPSWCTSPP